MGLMRVCFRGNVHEHDFGFVDTGRRQAIPDPIVGQGTVEIDWVFRLFGQGDTTTPEISWLLEIAAGADDQGLELLLPSNAQQSRPRARGNGP
jgi:hypothetical protein